MCKNFILFKLESPLILNELALWADPFYQLKCPFVCLSVCSSHFLTLFNGLLAPTSRSPISKLFRFLELLGKINGLRFENFCS